MPYTFFTITVPSGENPRDWARNNWDSYGFDYDPQKLGIDTVCAWADEISDDELRENLEADDVEFSTFEVEDLDQFFGL